MGEAAERVGRQQVLPEYGTEGLGRLGKTCSPSTAPPVDRPSVARLLALVAAIICCRAGESLPCRVVDRDGDPHRARRPSSRYLWGRSEQASGPLHPSPLRRETPGP